MLSDGVVPCFASQLDQRSIYLFLPLVCLCFDVDVTLAESVLTILCFRMCELLLAFLRRSEMSFFLESHAADYLTARARA